MRLVGDWAAAGDGSAWAAAGEAWPGGPQALMGMEVRPDGSCVARVVLPDELPVSTVTDGQPAARAWCVRSADAALSRRGVNLFLDWAMQRGSRLHWRADGGTTKLPLTLFAVGNEIGRWRGVVERADKPRETVGQPDFRSMQQAMAWCERTADTYTGSTR